MGAVNDTNKTYSLLWNLGERGVPKERWHFDAMQEVIDVPIVKGGAGIEVGSGCGYDTYIMAKANPSTRIVSIDISDGIFNTAKLTRDLGNVTPIKSSALDLPLKSARFDFAYSFGVLHHTPDPKRGLREIRRVLKAGSPAFLYLYEDHSEDLFKYIAVRMVSALRAITTRIPKKALYIISLLISPVIFIIFTLPAKILSKFKLTKSMAGRMPFNFGKGPFSLQKDLYDRLGAPLEYRFSRKEVRELFEECGFNNVKVTRLRDTAGWVVWGHAA